MLGAGLSVGSVALQRRGGQPPEWPEDAVALWLLFGQSNAEGYAPWRQDPARSDPQNAVAALTPTERAFHPWLRMSTRAQVPTTGQFPTSSQGIATDGTPRSSSHVWSAANGLGIPDGTQSFGPEIGLVRHVLEGAAPENWRDDSDPRLFILKQTEGARSVDHFRWGGPGQGLILDALRQSGGTNLSSLAGAKTVLLQGVIFAIGDKDSTTDEPGGGGSMANSLKARFADWVRQIRAALGVQVPVCFVELDEGDARKVIANGQLAALAAELPDAAILPKGADWTDVGDGVHYDAAGMDKMGRAAFAHLRETYGRSSDGLVMGRVFTGLKPWFHVPPQFIDESGTQMRLACVSAMTGTVHARITAHGAPVPSPEEIRAQSGASGGFSRAVTADVETNWWTPGEFQALTLQDVHYVLEDASGTLGEAVTVTRADGVRFAPDLSLDAAGSTTADFSFRPSFPGKVIWSLLPGHRGVMRHEDVAAKAFLPARWGEVAVTASTDSHINLTGLTAASDYTLFMLGERGSDGRQGIMQSVQFSTT